MGGTVSAVTKVMPKGTNGMGKGGGANPFGSQGSQLGNWDVLGRQMDKWNPYVKKARANEAIDAQQGASASAAGAVASNTPQYKSTLDATGRLGQQYQTNAQPGVSVGTLSAQPGVRADQIQSGQLNVKGLAPNQDALNAIKARAMSQGDSPWLKMQLEKSNLDKTSQLDQTGAQALSDAGTARSQLAMKGGLSSGASERLAAGAGRDMNASRQAIGRATEANNLNLGIADDQTKMGLLAQVPGMDLANANFNADNNKFNISSALDASKTNAANNLSANTYNSGQAYDASKTNLANQLSASQFNSGQAYDASKTNALNTALGTQGENAFNMGVYGQTMAGIGADSNAKAIAKQGKK